MDEWLYTQWEDRMLTREQLKGGLVLGTIGTACLVGLGFALQQITVRSAPGAIMIALVIPALGMVVSGVLDLYRILSKHRVRSRLRFNEHSIASEWEAKGWRPPASFDVPYEDAQGAGVGKGEFVFWFFDHSKPWNRKDGDLWFLSTKLDAFPDRETFDKLIGYLMAHNVTIAYGGDLPPSPAFGSLPSRGG